MVSTAYSEAATEVLEILKNMDEEAVSKIPKKFLDFLEENCSKTYKPEFDTSKPLEELELKPKTEAIFGMIFLKWWANNEEEKEEFLNKTKEKEEKYQEELREKYNPDNMFKNKTTIETNEDTKNETALIKIQEETLLQRIINKIKRIFRR